MLTHRITKRIDLLHEPGEWIEVRMPSLAILERATQAQSRKALGLMSAMAGLDLAQLQGFASGEPRAGGIEHDPITLLQSCITAWSYEDPLTPENIAELDGVTVGVLMAVLVPQETEAESKNGSGGSITPSKVRALRPANG